MLAKHPDAVEVPINHGHGLTREGAQLRIVTAGGIAPVQIQRLLVRRHLRLALA